MTVYISEPPAKIIMADCKDKLVSRLTQSVGYLGNLGCQQFKIGALVGVMETKINLAGPVELIP